MLRAGQKRQRLDARGLIDQTRAKKAKAKSQKSSLSKLNEFLSYVKSLDDTEGIYLNYPLVYDSHTIPVEILTKHFFGFFIDYMVRIRLSWCTASGYLSQVKMAVGEDYPDCIAIKTANSW
jgi:hypothetical protein